MKGARISAPNDARGGFLRQTLPLVRWYPPRPDNYGCKGRILAPNIAAACHPDRDGEKWRGKRKFPAVGNPGGGGNLTLKDISRQAGRDDAGALCWRSGRSWGCRLCSSARGRGWGIWRLLTPGVSWTCCWRRGVGGAQVSFPLWGMAGVGAFIGCRLRPGVSKFYAKTPGSV